MRELTVLVCPDSFKGSLSAKQAAAAMGSGVKQADPGAFVRELPLADGGEGTVEALVIATGGHFVPVRVTGPHGRFIEAEYGVLGDGCTAVIEAASAAGLLLLAPAERDPRITTSRGVGELMAAALTAGYRRLIVSLGGSGTNDGGLGLFTGLGGRVLSASDTPIELGGTALAQAATLDTSGLHPNLAEAQILIACDVDNPLLGPIGATAVYGPQKGATPQIVGELEIALTQWAQVLEQQWGRSVANVPGAGAAGGMAVPLLALGLATLTPGFRVVAQHTDLEAVIAESDLVITGEGRIDGQTLHGKVVHGVGTMASRYERPCIAIGGTVEPEADTLLEQGLTALFALPRGPATLNMLQAEAATLLTSATAHAVRLYIAARK